MLCESLAWYHNYCEQLSNIIFDIILSHLKCSDVPGWLSTQTLLQTNHPNRKVPFHLYAWVCNWYLFGDNSECKFLSFGESIVGWFKNTLFSQTEKLMAATNFSDYLGLDFHFERMTTKYKIPTKKKCYLNDGCSLDVGIVSNTPKPYILQKIFLAW